MGFLDNVVDKTKKAGSDFVETTTGQCDKPGGCGLFGEIDRGADLRASGTGPGEDTFSDDPDTGSGLTSGFFAGKNSLIEGAGQVGSTVTDPALSFLGFNVDTRQGPNGPEPENQRDQQRQNQQDQSGGSGLLAVGLAIGIGALGVLGVFN